MQEVKSGPSCQEIRESSLLIFLQSSFLICRISEDFFGRVRWYGLFLYFDVCTCVHVHVYVCVSFVCSCLAIQRPKEDLP